MSNTLSIGICAYNEEKNIKKLLINLLKEQDLDSSTEIIIVASGCTDKTIDIIKGFSTSQIKLIVEKDRNGKSSAVNLILRLSKGDFILFLPADVVPQKGSINKLLSRFDKDIGIVGGCPIPLNNKNSLMGNISHLIWRLHNRSLYYQSNKNSLTHISGEFFIMAKGMVDMIPADIINDDAYIAMTTVNKGFKILFDEDAKVSIKGPKTIYDYFIQRRRVVFGHNQIKKFGLKQSNALENMILSKPLTVLRILYKEVEENPTELIFLLFAIILEIIVNIFATFDIITRKKSHQKWSIAKTTK